MARGKVNSAIREAFEASGLTKREVARQLYGDAERWREFDRYLKDGGPQPRLPIAVELARVLQRPPDAFLEETPLVAVATELGEANQLAASLLARLQALEAAVTELPTAEDLEQGLRTVRVAIDALTKRGTRGATAATTRAAK